MSGTSSYWATGGLARSSTRSPITTSLICTCSLCSPIPPLGPLVGIKLISVSFDLVLGYFSYRIVRLRYPHGWAPTVAAAAVLFLPTVVLNSALWGQIDATYTSLALGGLYFMLRRRPWLACTFFGLALSFKLQVVFLFPVLLLLLLRRWAPWRALLMVPLVFVLMDLPALVVRRLGLDPVVDLYGRESGSTSNSRSMPPTSTSTSASTESTVLRDLGIALTLAIVLALIAIVVVRRTQLTPTRILLAGTVIGTPGALPPAGHARALLLPGRRPHGDLGVLPASTAVGLARPGAVRFAHVLHALPVGHHDHGRRGGGGNRRWRRRRPAPAAGALSTARRHQRLDRAAGGSAGHGAPATGAAPGAGAGDVLARWRRRSGQSHRRELQDPVHGDAGRLGPGPVDHYQGVPPSRLQPERRSWAFTSPVRPIRRSGASPALSSCRRHDRGRRGYPSANGANSLRSIEVRMRAKSPSSVCVLPGPPGNSVSPVSTTGEPSIDKAHRPGRMAGRGYCADLEPADLERERRPRV